MGGGRHQRVRLALDGAGSARARPRAALGAPRHYNLALIDYLYDTAVALLGTVEGPKVVAGWRRTKLMHAPLLRHGMSYGLEAQRRAEAAGPSQAAPLHGEEGWVAALVGSAQPLRYRPTAGDVTMLLAQPANATAEQLSDAAIARGLHLPPSKAAKLAPEAAVAEQVVLLYCNPTRPGCNPTRPGCNPTRPGCNPTRLGCSPTRPVCNHMHPGAACARGGQLPPPAAAASHAHRAAVGDGNMKMF